MESSWFDISAWQTLLLFVHTYSQKSKVEQPWTAGWICPFCEKSHYNKEAKVGICLHHPCQVTALFCSWVSLWKLTWVQFHRQTDVLKWICHPAIWWFVVFFFFTPPIVLQLEIQAGEMWKQLGLIHSCCYSFCFHWSYSKAEFSTRWTTCSPKLELRGEGFRADHATRRLLQQLNLPREGQLMLSSGYWM